MAKVVSYSVGNGDMFLVCDSENYNIIDCNIISERKDELLNCLRELRVGSFYNAFKPMNFISTHPDNDHVTGLELLHCNNLIDNFYCVKNDVFKDDSLSLEAYMSLRDKRDSKELKKGVLIGDSIKVLWPDRKSELFKQALLRAEKNELVNNISPIIVATFGTRKFLWLGDMETDFLNSIKDEVDWPMNVDVLFAPHHGRDSAKISESILNKINPKLVIVGEAPSEFLNYYRNWKTITQNSAGDIYFELDSSNLINIYVSSATYSNRKLADIGLDLVLTKLIYKNGANRDNYYYLGTMV